jgi:hypothetical protein
MKKYNINISNSKYNKFWDRIEIIKILQGVHKIGCPKYTRIVIFKDRRYIPAGDELHLVYDECKEGRDINE